MSNNFMSLSCEKIVLLLFYLCIFTFFWAVGTILFNSKTTAILLRFSCRCKTNRMNYKFYSRSVAILSKHFTQQAFITGILYWWAVCNNKPYPIIILNFMHSITFYPICTTRKTTINVLLLHCVPQDILFCNITTR